MLIILPTKLNYHILLFLMYFILYNIQLQVCTSFLFVFNFFIIIKLSADGNSNTRVMMALGTTMVLTEVITAAAVREFL